MFSKKVHRNIFLFGIVSAPLGVLIGRAPGSWPIIILGANWLLEGQFLLKWQRYKTNPVFLTLISLFVLTVLGLMYTQDMGSGINEFRIDLPLIVLPLAIFSGESFSKKELRFVLYSLVLGCFLSSLWCLLYGFVIHHIEEGRNLSRFMSHIRFGMYINLAIATCIYLFLKSHRIFHKIAWFILAIYFLISMLMMGLASGLIVFCVLLFLVLIYSIYKQTFKYKILGFAGLAALLLISVRYTLNISKQQLEVLDSSYNQLKSANAKGKTYMHFDSLGVLENGNYVFRNIQLQDLRTAWNKRVPEDTFSYNPQHNLKRYDVLFAIYRVQH